MTGYRVATLDDLDAVTSVMATAFSADPVWGPYSFPDDDRRLEQLAQFWRPQLAAAMRFPWTMVTHHCEAAAVWIPPGEPEMSPPGGARPGRAHRADAGGRPRRGSSSTSSGVSRTSIPTSPTTT